MSHTSLLDLRAEARARRPEVSVPLALAPAVVATWRARLVNEHGSSYVFGCLAEQLAALGWSDDAAEARSFADEEREHGRLCGAVVEAAGGDALSPTEAPPTFPLHAPGVPADRQRHAPPLDLLQRLPVAAEPPGEHRLQPLGPSVPARAGLSCSCL